MYTRFSYRLLQVASALPPKSVELWSIIPQATTHSMVHAPTMYALAEKLHRNHYYPIPAPLLPDGNFITARNFEDIYVQYEDKRAL